MSTTKKIMSAIAAIVLLVSVTMLSVAFKADNKSNVTQMDPDPVTYYYTEFSDLDTEVRDVTNWSPNEGELDCSGESHLCQVTYDQNVYPSLSNFLSINNTKAKIELNSLSISYKDQL